MEKDNCLNCMYSEFDDISLLLGDFTETNKTKCSNPNSPYYNRIADEDTTCRLFVDSIHYFSQKDRKDKLDNLKNNKFNDFD
jgi:hypothetical protein